MMDIALVYTLDDTEFERLQLEADHVFCRRCGVMGGLAIPMQHVAVRRLHVTFQEVASFHVYCCPVCGHHAMSEQHLPEAQA